MECRICNGRSVAYAQVLVLNKHHAELVRCAVCGFVSLEPITWLAEAYKAPLKAGDVGYVSRNLQSAEYTSLFLLPSYKNSEVCCDYGGGCGMFVRIMRDKGFRFHWHDPHCSNQFAAYCEAVPEVFAPYKLVTAFEVFEHFPDPAVGLTDILRFGPRILFTTEVLPQLEPLPEQWWYFGFEHGQHVAFYSQKSLRALGDRFGLSYLEPRSNWHFFGHSEDIAADTNRLAPRKRRWFERKPVLPPQLKSLLMSDFRAVIRFESGAAEHKSGEPKNIDLLEGLRNHGK